MTCRIAGANAHRRDPAQKINAPAANARPGPMTAVRRPVQVAATMEDARKAVVGQLISAAPPTSLTILGSTVATSRTFIECSSTPPSSTANDGINSGVRSARQLVRGRSHSWLGGAAFLKDDISERV